MLKKNIKGNTLFIETEFGDIELIFFDNCVAVTRPQVIKLKKNKNLFNFFKRIKNYDSFEKTSILIIEKRIFKKNIKSKT
jgi:hypothetical protein